jgi:hypothetical protein
VSVFFFPDNTVLCNFAAVGRLDLLAGVLDGRGRWTAAVAYEASRSAHHHPTLADLPTAGWLGEPIEVTEDADIQQVNLVRRAVFGGTDDLPLKHLGEAETCHIILHWEQFNGSWWISDDREALIYARGRGITTRETLDMVAAATVAGAITAQDGFDLLQKMVDADRHLRLPTRPSDLLL